MSSLLPAPSTIVVVLAVIVMFFAEPRQVVGSTSESLTPVTSSMRVPPVITAMSDRLSFLLSP